MSFQYISCYCLSRPLRLIPLPFRGFQYISCYCLSMHPTISSEKLRNFNTSHVTVYRKKTSDYSRWWTFQYISCYCLSLSVFNASSVNQDFNTSHVTVYQVWKMSSLVNYLISIHLMLLFIGWTSRKSGRNGNISIHLMLLFIKGWRKIHCPICGFQYISCYCLSHAVACITAQILEFQYISCYCLSQVT